MRRTTKSRVAIRIILLLVLAVASAFAVEAKKADKDAKRAEIDAMAAKSLETVLAKCPEAKGLQRQSIGYAAFENVKVAIGLTGGGGSGVAVEHAGKRVYMKMGTAGIGLGIGAQKYQVVFFFESSQALTSFIENGWQADTSAQAVAADKGANAVATFKNGVAVFQLTDAGLMASVDIAGTKYWRTNDLN